MLRETPFDMLKTRFLDANGIIIPKYGRIGTTVGNKYLGVTFIEILISLFILSILLLGLDAMQVAVLREAKSAYYLSVAANQLDTMIERLSITQSNAHQQFLLWNKQNKIVLPQGRGDMQLHYPQLVLSIFWGDKQQKNCYQNTLGSSGCLRTVLILAGKNNQASF